MTIKAYMYMVHRSTMGGSSWFNTVYTDRRVAEAVAKSSAEEWVNCKVAEVKVRELNLAEGVVTMDLGHDEGVEVVMKIDRRKWDDYLRTQALKKLTPEELRVLKLKL